jgi:hypothetical protein
MPSADIGRQGHGAFALDGGPQLGPAAVEDDLDGPVAVLGRDLAVKRAEGERIIGLEALARPGEGEPTIGGLLADQESLNLATARARAQSGGPG